MKKEVILDDFGFFCGVVQCPDDVINEGSIPYEDVLNFDELHYYENGEWQCVCAKPSPIHILDKVNKLWIDPRALDEIKFQKWSEVKSLRDQIEFGGLEFEGNIYDSDQVSQARIMGAASAQIDQIWTLANNKTVELTAAQLGQLYQALQAHIANIHERGRIAREAIQAATTKEQIEAIVF